MRVRPLIFPSCARRFTIWSVDPLPEMSNFYCHPGRAGGLSPTPVGGLRVDVVLPDDIRPAHGLGEIWPAEPTRGVRAGMGQLERASAEQAFELHASQTG